MADVTIHKLARWLRREFPVDGGLGAFRRVPMSPLLHGHVGPSGVIYLNLANFPNTQRETLMHEWAHIRIGVTIKDHTVEFWKELGRINNAYDAWRETL